MVGSTSGSGLRSRLEGQDNYLNATLTRLCDCFVVIMIDKTSSRILTLLRDMFREVAPSTVVEYG